MGDNQLFGAFRGQNLALGADTIEDFFFNIYVFFIHLSFTHIQASDVHSMTCTSAVRLNPVYSVRTGSVCTV